MDHKYSHGLFNKLLTIPLFILIIVSCGGGNSESEAPLVANSTPEPALVAPKPILLPITQLKITGNKELITTLAKPITQHFLTNYDQALNYKVIFSIDSDPENGKAEFIGNEMTYTPYSNAKSTDSFKVKASIDDLTDVITITIHNYGDNGPLKVSGDINLITRQESPITYTLSTNYDLDSHIQVGFSTSIDAEFGEVSFSGNEMTYTPFSYSKGPDTFKVKAFLYDINGIATELSDEATISIDNKLAFKGNIIANSMDGVEVLLTGNGYLRTVIPEPSGEFKFYDIKDGDYSVKVRKSGYKSQAAKNFSLNIEEINQLQFNTSDKEESTSSPVSGNNFSLEVLSNENFIFHWEEDQSIAGYEYFTLINDSRTSDNLDELITVVGSAANRLQHDYNIILVNTDDAKWTQEHAYRIVEIMKMIPQDKRDPYSYQSLPESRWQLTSESVLNDIQISEADEYKAVVISDAIFGGQVTEEQRQSFYSQELHEALTRFVTDNTELTGSSWDGSPYLFPGKVKRIDINVIGEAEDDKTVIIEIDIHALDLEFEGAQYASMQFVSEIGSYSDVYLYPVDVNGELLSDGELGTTLKGQFTLSKYAKPGFWSVQKIVVTDSAGDDIKSGNNDFGGMFYVNNSLGEGLLFFENFDGQADWATAGSNLLGDLPSNWDAGRTDENWHPEDGHEGAMPSMLISGNNIDQVYGDKGKSFITYSESFNDSGNNGYTSDGFITKDIAASNEVYLEFKIKFQTGFAGDLERGGLKVARIVHWDGPDSGNGERHAFFSSGNNAPMYIFDWGQSDYGVRQHHAFRCDNQLTNYYCTSPAILDAPRAIGLGEMSANYSTHVARETPSLPDLANGGLLNYTGTHFHSQVWGDIWHTVGIHVKLNSAPGVQDGVYQYWLDGQKVMSLMQVPWIGTDGDMDSKWNSVSFGGNDSFHFNLDEDASYADRERWYAIDDIKIYNILPERLID